MTSLGLVLGVLAAFGAGFGCGDDDPAKPQWQLVQEDLPGALLSVWGTSATEVWAVGGDAGDGSGPLVLRYDGTGFERVATGQTAGDLWWVFGFADGPVYFGGAGGVILVYRDGTFTRMPTPGTNTVFGIWGPSPDEVWAVGGSSDAMGGFVWRLDGEEWRPETSLPEDVPDRAAIWKVYGAGADDVWFVGSNGVSLHWDGAELSLVETGVGSSLFTVHVNGGRVAAVGGIGTGIIVENNGGTWELVNQPQNGLSGVCLGAGETGYAVGAYGSVYSRDATGWHELDIGIYVNQNLHSVWIDPTGGVWAAGGQTVTTPLTAGLLIHGGEPLRGEE